MATMRTDKLRFYSQDFDFERRAYLLFNGFPEIPLDFCLAAYCHPPPPPPSKRHHHTDNGQSPSLTARHHRDGQSASTTAASRRVPEDDLRERSAPGQIRHLHNTRTLGRRWLPLPAIPTNQHKQLHCRIRLRPRPGRHLPEYGSSLSSVVGKFSRHGECGRDASHHRRRLGSLVTRPAIVRQLR